MSACRVRYMVVYVGLHGRRLPGISSARSRQRQRTSRANLLNLGGSNRAVGPAASIAIASAAELKVTTAGEMAVFHTNSTLASVLSKAANITLNSWSWRRRRGGTPVTTLMFKSWRNGSEWPDIDSACGKQFWAARYIPTLGTTCGPLHVSHQSYRLASV